MAVERLTDYTRRIWTALDADAPEGHDFEVGDVIYYMDSSKCGIVTYVYPEGSIDVEFLPDIGGGGGGGSTIISKTITANGTYYASADSADGYNPVTVNVSAPPVRYENFVFKLHNALGGHVVFVSTFYDSNNDKLTLFVYATQAPGSEIQKTCLIQDGKVQLALTTNYAVGSVTYNGQPLNATISGPPGRLIIEFEIPDSFDPNIPIYFNT